MPESTPRAEGALRGLLLVGYLAVIPLVLFADHGPRIVWTVVIAALPAFWVAGGYHLWRRICPLAFFAQLPSFLRIGGKRRLATWSPDRAILLQLSLMVVALVLRLVAINGGRVPLAIFWATVTVAAIVSGFIYRGRTWCHYICPVGLVEKLYTEPATLRPEPNSQCSPCSACTKRCADIDPELGYWNEANGPGRRIAYFAWPGIVVGFYAYFFLQSGTWDSYFSGAWCYESDQAARWLDAGFFFAPAIPRTPAALLTLVAFGAISYAISSALFRLTRRPTADGEPAYHRAFAIAGFAAFNAFYFFAGQPTLLRLPVWLQRVVAFGLVALAAGALFLRLRRTHADYIKESFAKRVARRWSWDDAPDAYNAGELVAVHQERTRERKVRLESYGEAVRELVSDGVVERGELKLLDSLRGQLGISDEEHDKVLAALEASDRRLFDPDVVSSQEERLQTEQYARELERMMADAAEAGRAVRDASVEKLRALHGITDDQHDAIVERLGEHTGPMTAFVLAEVESIEALARATAAARDPDAARPAAPPDWPAFFVDLCGIEVRRHLQRITAALGSIGASLDGVVPALLADEARRREIARRRLDKTPASPALPRLDAALSTMRGEAVDPAEAATTDALAALTDHPAPHLRAVALLLYASRDPIAARSELLRAAPPQSPPAIREAVALALANEPSLGEELAAAVFEAPHPELAALRARAAETDRRDPVGLLELIVLLRGLDLLTDVPLRALEELAGLIEQRRLVADEALCVEGEDGDEVFLIADGLVAVTQVGADGEVHRIAEFGAGSCLGELAVLDPAPRSATISAVEATTVLVLPGAAFRGVIQARPGVAAQIAGELARRLRAIRPAG